MQKINKYVDDYIPLVNLKRDIHLYQVTITLGGLAGTTCQALYIALGGIHSAPRAGNPHVVQVKGENRDSPP